MIVEDIFLRYVRLPFVHFFETSFGREYEKHTVLVEARSQGVSGWGECVAGERPDYGPEYVKGAWYVLHDHLAPSVVGQSLQPFEKLLACFVWVRGNQMARAALEGALWDLSCKVQGIPLWKALGGVYKRIPCGVSIGIQDSVEQLLDKISIELQAGYKRIKLKIKPGWDLQVLEEVRSHYPATPLMVDANAAYTDDDFDHLQALDNFDLMMIEQPLYHDDLLLHRRLQGRMSTPVCLDESIGGLHDAELALSIDACRVINIKPGRVGGLTEAKQIHQACWRREVPVWCGGMLETGIGRAHNIALSTLENFALPGDVSASNRYFEQDIISPPVAVTNDGCIEVPQAPGIGYTPDLDRIEAITVRSERVG
jgi:O-succinylbenzoate synthase